MDVTNQSEGTLLENKFYVFLFNYYKFEDLWSNSNINVLVCA